jgi:hypothetical protein
VFDFSLWLDLFVRIVVWLPWGDRVIRYPRFHIDAGKPYQVMDANPERDHSQFVIPGIVRNIGSAVGESCYVQLISITAITHMTPRWQFGHQIAAHPVRWADQSNESVQYRPIQPGGMLSFTMARRRKPIMERDERPSYGYGWLMDLASWEDGQLPMVFQEGEGTYEVKVAIVGDNFRMRPYTYCVSLNDSGDLCVYEPMGIRRRLFEWIKDPLGNKRAMKRAMK